MQSNTRKQENKKTRKQEIVFSKFSTEKLTF